MKRTDSRMPTSSAKATISAASLMVAIISVPFGNCISVMSVQKKNIVQYIRVKL